MSEQENNQDEYKPIISEYDTIVISGGAIKGMAAIGSLQYLYDKFLCEKVVNYFGTSCGSMICYLLAIGYTPIEIMVYICTHNLLEHIKDFNLVEMINGNGATQYTHIQESLEKMTMDKIGKYITLKQLKDEFGKNLTCVTHNMTLNKTEYLDSETYPDLPCLVAVRMSSNVPLLFDSFKYMGSYYIDGALSDNFPLIKAQEVGKKIMGIVIYGQNPPEQPKDNMIQYIFGFLNVLIRKITEYQVTKAEEKSTVVKIHTEWVKAFDFSLKSRDKLEMFSEGYQIMKNHCEA